ncbi:hypothetical protein GUITHDRAFT_156536 [Guillardia theta CCMP2712]|uniref:Uncharacterized protein n=1 Tax=Guillardia theta (strain CCMP2712) TaxID=905079 RepID=L1I6W2_GUITC|nr:hypothetical protein GUITHDRAFT_156536 [Guillardia theta CCMP2712]EKX31610.1 hypothetical protein GUITHDRAFT_156536 [Guillardia theta CCMP2712]|eukprot:XP_005818590.1 hypothetical protein GUITHDRAFT_156536 [Guillardia theta CCMP2712]
MHSLRSDIKLQHAALPANEHTELVADVSEDEDELLAELDFPAVNSQFETSTILAEAAPPRVFRRSQRTGREVKSGSRRQCDVLHRGLRNRQVGRDLNKANEARRLVQLRVVLL